MNDLEARIREVLHEDANRAPFVGAMPERVRPRVRRRQAATVLAASLAAAALIAGSVSVVRSLQNVPADPAPQSLQLTATIGGAVEVSSPRDWYLVDHWPATDSEIHPPSQDPLVLFEVANFDPGLTDAVCPAEPGGERSMPASGIAVSVTLGTASDAAGRCAGAIVDVRTGTVRYPASRTRDPASRTRAWWWRVRTRPNAIARSLPRSSIRSSRPAPSRSTGTAGGTPPMSWTDGRTRPRRPRSRRVPRMGRWSSPSARSRARTPEESSIEVSGSQPVEAPDWGAATFGAVTDDVARVELHRAGIDQPFVAERIQLPPSLNAGFDAFVFEPQPEGGPYEVVGYGADGEVLYSSFPPLTDTERVGTVRAFGTTWAVKSSSAADGYWGTSCVEPAATSTLDPCPRGWGGGLLIQTFETPAPAVFVTQGVGVVAVDVVTDDGLRYPAMMVPSGGGSVAVIPLEGAGEGRFVYQMSDGRVDEGRRPEAHVEWPDVGQVIGDVGIV